MQTVTNSELCRCVLCIQARIAQKDETLTRYQHLLEQARAEMTEMQRHHSDEMQALQQQLHQKNDAAFKKYRMAVKESLSKPDNPVVTTEQVLGTTIVALLRVLFLISVLDIIFDSVVFAGSFYNCFNAKTSQ